MIKLARSDVGLPSGGILEGLSSRSDVGPVHFRGVVSDPFLRHIQGNTGFMQERRRGRPQRMEA
jgi:hypothetical protein